MRALALASADLYVAAAYLIFLTLVVVYVVILQVRFARASNQAEVLTRLAREDDRR